METSWERSSKTINYFSNRVGKEGFALPWMLLDQALRNEKSDYAVWNKGILGGGDRRRGNSRLKTVAYSQRGNATYKKKGRVL